MQGKLAAAAALGLCLTAAVFAGDDATPAKKLTIGDTAPPIDIAHWIKGVTVEPGKKFTPMTNFEDGKVYVIEFWATWCGPCKASMPHLSSLQEKYKDYGVTVISVSDEPLSTVVPFLFTTWKQDGKVQNDRIQYTLTTDPDESVKNDYFRAAGQTGIPCAFIVGKTGKVEWYGHPMEMDKPLDAVVFDTWDRDAYKVRMEKEKAAQEKLKTAIKSQDWDAVLGIYDEMLEADPENLGVMLQRFNLLLMTMDRPKEAYASGKKLLKAGWDNAQLLNAVAWTVVDNPAVKKRDLDFAMKAAKRADDLTDSKDPAILDTLARVYYEQGDLERAVKVEQKAADNAGDDPMGADIKKTLEKYKKEVGR